MPIPLPSPYVKSFWCLQVNGEDVVVSIKNESVDVCVGVKEGLLRRASEPNLLRREPL